MVDEKNLGSVINPSVDKDANNGQRTTAPDISEKEEDTRSEDEKELGFKPWSEASTEDKIERCNAIVREVSELLGDLQKRMDKLEKNFFNHSHKDESIVARINQFDGNSLTDAPERKPANKRWF